MNYKSSIFIKDPTDLCISNLFFSPSNMINTIHNTAW